MTRPRYYRDREESAGPEIAWLRDWAASAISGEPTDARCAELAEQAVEDGRLAAIDVQRACRAIGYASIGDFVMDRLDELQD